MFIRLSIIVSLVAMQVQLLSQSITTTKHNLSVSSAGTIKATSESEVCIFCHTPHSAAKVPLWNRNDPGEIYTLYNSSTIQALTGQPDGSSLLCLSCHDGTIALGNVLSRPLAIEFNSGVTFLPAGSTNLSTNLTNDHPISFIYSAALAASDGQIKDPSALTHPVSLESGKLQCTSCHDAHNNINNHFLVASTQNSSLCLYCHQKNSWSNSSHSTSTASWNNIGTNPWLHTPYTTVSENACENCHNPHSAGGAYRLMNYQIEESNCFTCHSGTVADPAKNIQIQFAKLYTHNISGYQQIHDPIEDAIVNIKHIECEDCHNPHAANNNTAVAPNVKGALAGVLGVDLIGNSVNSSLFEYQICFRCHADSPDKPISTIPRQITQNNVRLEFQTTNPSFHPVAGVGRNNLVPSLISPLSTSSMVYCADCHASDGAGSALGPHGSSFQRILKYQYLTTYPVVESSTTYQLCYSCHDRVSILGDESFKNHNQHIVDLQAPCSTCHDAHGINSSQGNIANNSNLINFNTLDVNASSGPGGTLRFDDLGDYTGRCFLKCHGKNHNPLSY